MTVIGSVLVAFGMTEWMCITIAIHISRFRLSKQVPLWTYVSVICQIRRNVFNIRLFPGIQGSFLTCFFSKDDNHDLEETIVEGEQNILYKKAWRAISNSLSSGIKSVTSGIIMWVFVNLRKKRLDHHTLEMNILIDKDFHWRHESFLLHRRLKNFGTDLLGTHVFLLIFLG